MPGALSRRTPQAVAAAIRASLPVGAYVKMLHDGAVRGRLPKLDHRGNPTGQFHDLDTKDRIDLLKYLVNKVMPDKHEVVAAANSDATDAEMARMSEDQLMEIINNPSRLVENENDASPESETPAGEAGAGPPEVPAFFGAEVRERESDV